MQNHNHWTSKIPLFNSGLDATTVNRHEKAKKVHSVSCQRRKFENELELAPIEMSEAQPTKLTKLVKQEAKRKGQEAIESKWKQSLCMANMNYEAKTLK